MDFNQAINQVITNKDCLILLNGFENDNNSEIEYHILKKWKAMLENLGDITIPTWNLNTCLPTHNDEYYEMRYNLNGSQKIIALDIDLIRYDIQKFKNEYKTYSADSKKLINNIHSSVADPNIDIENLKKENPILIYFPIYQSEYVCIDGNNRRCYNCINGNDFSYTYIESKKMKPMYFPTLTDWIFYQIFVTLSAVKNLKKEDIHFFIKDFDSMIASINHRYNIYKINK